MRPIRHRCRDLDSCEPRAYVSKLRLVHWGTMGRMVASPEATPATTPVPAVEVKKPKPEEFEIRDATTAELRVNIGSYWEGKLRSETVRIAVLGVDGPPGQQLVDLSFNSNGGMFYGGEKVKSPRVNTFSMPECTSGFQAEEKCVYNFSWSPDHVDFFVARVNGIDLHNREVVLNIANVRLFKMPR